MKSKLRNCSCYLGNKSRPGVGTQLLHTKIKQQQKYPFKMAKTCYFENVSWSFLAWLELPYYVMFEEIQAKKLEV